jgi:ribonuclease-3
VSKFDELQSRIGYQFKDLSLLRLSLTHPSIAQDAGITQENNQRLEFLGDAVIQLVLSRELYDRYPDHDEGTMTKSRSQLVRRETLTKQSIALGLGPMLILSRGEDLNGGRERPSILADAFESVVGAIFLDGGFEHARTFILNTFQPIIADLEVTSSTGNPKGDLQEVLQAISPDAPQYRLLSSFGPDHDKSFECAVIHKGEEIGRGTGKSKKLAESQAATAALERLRAISATPA